MEGMVDDRGVSLTTMLASALAGRVVSAVTRRVSEWALGTPEQRELDKIVRAAVEEAVSHHEELARKSVEIDLLGADEVAAELLSATFRPTDWHAAKARWFDLYQTSPPDELSTFLEEAAHALRARIQANPVLQGMWTARSLERVGGVIDQIATSIADPSAALRLAGDRLRSELPLTLAVAHELGAQFSSGDLAKLVDVRLSLAADSRLVAIAPKPGVDMKVTLTKRAEDTPEGHAEIERLRAAAQTGIAFDATGVDFRIEAGGLVIIEEFGGRVQVSPVAPEIHLTLGIKTRRLHEQRVQALLGVTHVDDVVELRNIGRRGAIVVDGSIEPRARRLKLNLTTNEGRAQTLREQLECVSLAHRLAAGGWCEVWIDNAMRARIRYDPMPQFRDLSFGERALMLLAQVEQELGGSGAPARRITQEDFSSLVFARRLTTRGRARLPWAGTWRFTLDHDVRDVLKPQRSGRLPLLRMDLSSWPLEVAGRKLDLGPVTVLFKNLLPVESVTAVELGFEHTISFDARSTLTVIRPQMRP